MNDILIDYEQVSQIITSLDNEIKKLEDIYNEINNKMKAIDGSSDIWKGFAQERAYQNYLNISNEYPNTINQMKSLKLFLENSLNNYINGDNKINESIENNLKELDIN